MRLEQLEYFVKIAETKSITVAATKLNISQPSLSIALLEFEDEIGQQLFNRTSNGTILRDDAVELLKTAKEALKLLKKIQNNKKGIVENKKENLYIASIPSIESFFLIDTITSFNNTVSKANIYITSSSTEDVVKYLSSGAADIGLASSYGTTELAQKKCVILPLFSSRLVACMPKELSKSYKSQIELKELAKLPIISNFRPEHPIFKHITQEVPSFKNKDNCIFTTSYHSIFKLCLNGSGVAILPEFAANSFKDEFYEQLTKVSMQENFPLAKYYILYLKNKTRTNVFKEFVHYLSETASIFDKKHKEYVW